ncbi:MAG: hypothetical protein UH850_11245 [Paludibacteraceae bacterium]|nr:hypothetical protein [Paludibacteraceae bacterium]
MSNKTQLQTNNTNLDALIERVNAAKDTAASLPENGGSNSGGGNIETCTFEITFSSMILRYAVTQYINGEIINTCKSSLEGVTTLTISDVVKNSVIFLLVEGIEVVRPTNATVLYIHDDDISCVESVILLAG